MKHAFALLMKHIVAPHMREEALKSPEDLSGDDDLTLVYQQVPSLRYVVAPREADEASDDAPARSQPTALRFAAAPHSDDEFGHQPCEINFWLPLDDVTAATVLWAESEPMKGDFAPLLPQSDSIPAFIARFYGARCRHFSLREAESLKSKPRVSIDFRVCFKKYFDFEYQLPGMSHRHSMAELS